MTGQPSYLLERGFSEETIARVGWRVEPLGEETRRYGLPPEAAGALAWWIPYRHCQNGQVAFERIRLIDEADLERFGGGKYRQPAGRSLELYDPFGVLTSDKPLDFLLLVEGEANAVAVYEMAPEQAVVGLPGQRALKPELAERLGHAAAVYVWLDRGEEGYESASIAIDERLRAAGVEEVLFVDSGAEDANEILVGLGREGAHQRFCEVLNEAQPRESARAPLEPIDLAELLHAVERFLARFVVMGGGELVAATLWTAHTHAIAAAETTPYLAITSAEKQSGKTRLQECLGLLVAAPLSTLNISDAALFRAVAASPRTLLFDETDAIFGPKVPNREDLRALINAGHRRGAKVTRCVGDGSRQKVEDFEVFGPKALSGIGALPDTVTDRSIPIRLRRRAPVEHIDRFRRREVEPESEVLRAALERWAEEATDELSGAVPELPAALDDRAADGWEPLFAIADAAGGEWAERARRAAVDLSAGQEVEDESVGVRLLADIRAVFDAQGADRIASTGLLEGLHELDEAPWGEWYGKPLTARGLSKLLHPYGVRRRTVRLESDTAKGYLRDQFEDAWTRYLRPEPPQRRSQGHNPHGDWENAGILSGTDEALLPFENGRNPASEAGCDPVTDSGAVSEETASETASEADAEFERVREKVRRWEGDGP